MHNSTKRLPSRPGFHNYLRGKKQSFLNRIFLCVLCVLSRLKQFCNPVNPVKKTAKKPLRKTILKPQLNYPQKHSKTTQNAEKNGYFHPISEKHRKTTPLTPKTPKKREKTTRNKENNTKKLTKSNKNPSLQCPYYI